MRVEPLRLQYGDTCLLIEGNDLDGNTCFDKYDNISVMCLGHRYNQAERRKIAQNTGAYAIPKFKYCETSLNKNKVYTCSFEWKKSYRSLYVDKSINKLRISFDGTRLIDYDQTMLDMYTIKKGSYVHIDLKGNIAECLINQADKILINVEMYFSDEESHDIIVHEDLYALFQSGMCGIIKTNDEFTRLLTKSYNV